MGMIAHPITEWRASSWYFNALPGRVWDRCACTSKPAVHYYAAPTFLDWLSPSLICWIWSIITHSHIHLLM